MSEWRLEILVLLVIVVAIFLLVEDMQIRESLTGWLAQMADGVMAGLGRINQWLGRLVRATTPSNLAGYGLLIGAGALVVIRVRWRLMHSPRFTEQVCPQCGGELYRVHRHTADRVLHLLVPVRRYRCRNQACQWRGLRVRKPH